MLNEQKIKAYMMDIFTQSDVSIEENLVEELAEKTCKHFDDYEFQIIPEIYYEYARDVEKLIYALKSENDFDGKAIDL